MKYIIGIILIIVLLSCGKEDDILPYPCIDGNCEVFFEIDELVSPDVYQDSNEYWHIQHQGFNYFTIKGKLDELHPYYVINDVPS